MIEHHDEDTPEVNPGDPSPNPIPSKDLVEGPDIPEVPQGVPNTPEAGEGRS